MNERHKSVMNRRRDRGDFGALSLWLNAQNLAAMIDHADRVYPEECCGLLVGTIAGDGVSVIEVCPMVNDWEVGDRALARDFETAMLTYNGDDSVENAIAKSAMPSAERRYTIAPRALLAIQKRARDRGLAIVGVYHSHPEHPAIPSEYDREFAWDGYVYPIVSVRRGHPSDVRAWQLNADRQFQELELRLVDTNG